MRDLKRLTKTPINTPAKLTPLDTGTKQTNTRNGKTLRQKQKREKKKKVVKYPPPMPLPPLPHGIGERRGAGVMVHFSVRSGKQ